MHIDFPYAISLGRIANSGQCFRLRRHRIGYYVYDKYQLFNTAPTQLWVNNEALCALFPNDVDYNYVEQQMIKQGGYLKEAAEFGHGMVILRQPVFEMVVSFIISQRNNIPRITSIIDALCSQFDGSFPTREQLLGFDWDTLNVGYRKPYLEKSVMLCTDTYIQHLQELPNTEAKIEYLKRLPGVGDKVANCIALFGLGCYDAFPIDVWVQRIIDEEFGGNFDTSWCKDYAGIVQQYMFYFERYRRIPDDEE